MGADAVMFDGFDSLGNGMSLGSVGVGLLEPCSWHSLATVTFDFAGNGIESIHCCTGPPVRRLISQIPRNQSVTFRMVSLPTFSTYNKSHVILRNDNRAFDIHNETLRSIIIKHQIKQFYIYRISGIG